MAAESDLASFPPQPVQAVNAKTLMWRVVDKTVRIRFIVLSSEYATSGCQFVEIRDELSDFAAESVESSEPVDAVSMVL